VTILEASGTSVGPSLLRRIERTLLALAAGAGGTAPAPGRLDQELEPPGFEAIVDFPAPQPPRRDPPYGVASTDMLHPLAHLSPGDGPVTRTGGFVDQVDPRTDVVLLLQLQLPVAHVDPAPEFETDLFEMCHLLETEPLVQADARVVRQRDYTHDAVKTACPKGRQQRAVEL